MSRRDYDSTVARIAGNIMSGASSLWVNGVSVGAVARAVEAARAIVDETKRTETPALPPPPPPPVEPPPPPVECSPDGTVCPPAPEICDEVGAHWTINDGALLRNGVLGWDGAYQAIAWCGGQFYMQSDGGQWYQRHGSFPAIWWTPCPAPALPPPTGFAALSWDHNEDGWPLELEGYVVTFEDDFADARAFIQQGNLPPRPGDKWFAGAQGGPFGQASVGYGVPSDAYVNLPTGLGIVAIRDANQPRGWRSGSIQTVNTLGQGFAQQGGIFQARMKLPPSAKAWPAFWLKHQAKWPADQPNPPLNVEFDVFEWYGLGAEGGDRHLWHVIHRGGYHGVPRKHHEHHSFPPVDLTADFHDYTVKIDDDWFRVYFDGVCVGRFPMTEDFRQPLYPMLTLSIKDNAPDDAAISPMTLAVASVKVWALA